MRRDSDIGRARGPEPRPLVDEGGQAGAYLESAHAAFEPRVGEEARAWAALERRRGRDRRLRGLLIGGLGASGGALVLGLALLIVRAKEGRRPPAPLAAVPSAPSVPSVPSVPSMPSVPSSQSPPEAPPAAGATPAPVALATGRSIVAAGVRAHLSPAGRAAILSAAPARASLSLERGTLEVDADAEAAAAGARASSARVEVRVAAYRLEGETGRFKVSVRPGAVDLVVQKGEVAVWLQSRRVARVYAGQRWTDLRAPARAGAAPSPAEMPRPEPSVAGEPRDCASAGSTEERVACLEQQAGGAGLSGELALLELARIRRDVAGDLAGSERALGQYLRRFPRGSFVADASSLRVELLLKLGRPAEALGVAEHLPGGEGTFWRAMSLAELGRKAESRRAFDEYLARPDGRRRAEATRKRQELGP